jgi:hypothetical protein
MNPQLHSEKPFRDFPKDNLCLVSGQILTEGLTHPENLTDDVATQDSVSRQPQSAMSLSDPIGHSSSTQACYTPALHSADRPTTQQCTTTVDQFEDAVPQDALA